MVRYFRPLYRKSLTSGIGELVLFFRSTPRIVRNVLRGLTEGAAKAPEEHSPPQQEQPPQLLQQQKTSYFQSPALVADAVRRLGLAAIDRTVAPIDPRQPETGLHILRAMTNLLTKSNHQKIRRGSESRHVDDVQRNFSVLPTRSSLFLTTTTNISGADQKVAFDYVFIADSLAEVCEKNAVAAKEHGRHDHERIFSTLRTLFRPSEGGRDKWRPPGFSSDALAKQVIIRL